MAAIFGTMAIMDQTNKLLNTEFTSPTRRNRTVTIVLASALIIIFSFTAGFYVGEERGAQKSIGSGQVFGKEKSPPSEYLIKDVNFDIFWQVWNLLQDEYVDRPIAETRLFYGALQGLVAGTGDPYTVFLDPKTAGDFNQELAGSFEGIGAEIGLRDSRIVVIAPLSGTPAEKAGLKSKDSIMAIDGRETLGMSLEAAVAAIRGKGGTTVTLTIVRNEAEDAFEVKIVRAVIDLKSVEFSMMASSSSAGADVAYLKISHFNEDTAADFSEAVNSVLVKNPRAIILDLQNNPGGLLETAIDVAGYWIPEGTIVYQQAHGEARTEFKASGQSPLDNIKTIVLVNAGSASASEIVAGALQDYRAATIVGEKTFGKGSVQELQSLPDGSAVKITVAKWLTPTGRSIEGSGIEPDVAVTIDRGLLPDDENSDPVLDRALELLK